MSDGFDKEAEREKLREKFAEDEQKREHTQRMSELLLQGATMTNRHCETCGDPIFRNDGQEFCPTCHATEDGYEMPANGASGADENGKADAATEPAAQNATDAGLTAGEPAGVDAVDATDAGPTRSEPAGGDPVNNAPTKSESAEGDDSPEAPVDATAPQREAERSAGAAERTAAAEPAGELAEARRSLTRTVTRFARAAAETDDPRRAREHLQAAREAAEAVSALER